MSQYLSGFYHEMNILFTRGFSMWENSKYDHDVSKNSGFDHGLLWNSKIDHQHRTL